MIVYTLKWTLSIIAWKPARSLQFFKKKIDTRFSKSKLDFIHVLSTFGADGCYVSPIVLLKDVDHGLSLELIGGHDADEIAEAVFVR